MWDEPLVCKKSFAKDELSRYHKRRKFIETAGRWSWKLKTAKECVTTHLPNELALKMDGAQAHHFSYTIDKSF